MAWVGMGNQPRARTRLWKNPTEPRRDFEMGAIGHQIPGPGKKVEEPQSPDPLIQNVIPIIFIPGIAGTNLKIKDKMEPLVRKRLGRTDSEELNNPWRPPNIGWKAIKQINEWSRYGPKERQVLLNSETTDVDDDGFLSPGMNGVLLPSFTISGRRFRGWNTVHHLSYGSFLDFLDITLNPRSLQSSRSFANEMIENRVNSIVDELIKFKGEFRKRMERNGLVACNLDRSLVEKIKSNHLPVYAFGYNWLKSNSVSGNMLYDKIKLIIKFYNEIKNNRGNNLFKCKNVILVTHSMGGLVSRSVLKKESDMGIKPKNSLIMGVVQVAMPAIGTPSAYRRMVSGVEWNILPEDALMFSRLRNGATILMGQTAEETTPVMSYSPGCLQLLPTADYPMGWLVVGFPRRGGSTDPLIKVPMADPYSEIYANSKAWFKLVNHEYLDPARLYGLDPASAWRGYLHSLSIAKTFHDGLKGVEIKTFACQIPTYVCYGNDPNQLSFGTIRWHLENPDVRVHASRERVWKASHCYSIPISSGIIRGIRFDDIKIKGYNPLIDCVIQPQDANGDGTVSWQSGRSPEDYGVKGCVLPLSGFEHQSAMKSEVVQMFTLWSICKIFESST